MFSSIILESVKEYIPNSYIENNEKYDFIVGSKVKKKRACPKNCVNAYVHISR